MPEFRVQLSASADVIGYAYIRADFEKEAIEKAKQINPGDVEWVYNGIQDGTVDYIGVSET